MVVRMRKVPYWLRHLNTCSPIDKAIYGHGLAFLEEVHLSGKPLRVHCLISHAVHSRAWGWKLDFNIILSFKHTLIILLPSSTPSRSSSHSCPPDFNFFLTKLAKTQYNNENSKQESNIKSHRKRSKIKHQTNDVFSFLFQPQSSMGYHTTSVTNYFSEIIITREHFLILICVEHVFHHLITKCLTPFTDLMTPWGTCRSLFFLTFVGTHPQRHQLYHTVVLNVCSGMSEEENAWKICI